MSYLELREHFARSGSGENYNKLVSMKPPATSTAFHDFEVAQKVRLARTGTSPQKRGFMYDRGDTMFIMVWVK